VKQTVPSKLLIL